MNIVLEGIDNSGKSTLAAALAQRLDRRVISSEGPEQWLGEMKKRVDKYLAIDNAIFDRHPCVSDAIYGKFRPRASTITPAQLAEFNCSSPLFIYCKPKRLSLVGHVVKEHDTPQHLEMVQKQYFEILALYNSWALDKADITYRLGDDITRIVTMASMFDPIADVQSFHAKFRQAYNGPPRALPDDLLRFREDFMQEELIEYKNNAHRVSALLQEEQLPTSEITSSLAEQLDALVDLVYVALGTAVLHGFNFREAWRRVHLANMQKERVASARDSARHSRFDIVKPRGWTPPDHLDLVRDHMHINIKKP